MFVDSIEFSGVCIPASSFDARIDSVNTLTEELSLCDEHIGRTVRVDMSLNADVGRLRHSCKLHWLGIFAAI